MSNRYIRAILVTIFLVFILFPTFADIPNTSNLQIRELKYDPYPAKAGKYLDLWIKVENYGLEKAENVTCILEPKYPFSLYEDEKAERNIGSLPAMEEVIFQYKLKVDKNAIEGWNEVNFSCTTNGKVWITRKIQIKVESKQAKFAIGKISSEPSELTPDLENAKLTVELENIGESDAKLVTVKLNLPKGITPSNSYSNIANLGIIKNDSSKEAIFYLDLDKTLKPKIYEGNLTIKYKDSSEGNYKEQTLPLELNVKPIPIFQVEEIKTTPSELSQGDEAKLRIKIKNIGSEEAKEVSVRIYKQADQPFDFDENYDYIGNLKPNQSGEAIYDFSVDNDANLKKYFLELEIRYVSNEEVKTVTKTISISVSKKKAIPMIYLIPVVIIVLIILVLWKYEKKKK